MGKGAGDRCRTALTFDAAQQQWKTSPKGRRYLHSYDGRAHTITCDDGMVVRYTRSNRPGYLREQRIANPQHPRAVDSFAREVIDMDVLSRWPEVVGADSSG
jgi:hypothetical protein